MSALPDGSKNAITIRNVVKSFHRRGGSQHHTTLKTELVRWLRGQRRPKKEQYIEALRGISLDIPRGSTFGLVGSNGSGKSTLLKLITGIYRPTSGSIELHGRISALLELGAGFHPDFTGRENILINGIILGMSRAETLAKMPEIIEFSELGEFVDEPVRTYSSGMYMRLAFSVATNSDPDILIVDEILAVGDDHFSRKSMAKMTEFKKRGKTIVLVTHDLSTVRNWCDRAAWLDRGHVQLVGEPNHVVDQYRQAVARAEASAQQKATPLRLSPSGAPVPTDETLPKPSLGPSVGSDRRWGTFELEIERLRLVDEKGQPASVVDPEAPLDVYIDYQARSELKDVIFGFGLFREDGAQVWGTNTFVEKVALPSPLPRQGTVRLSIARLGLLEGNYSINVAAHNEAGADYDFHLGLYTFSVRSRVRDVGFARPAHQWSLEATPSVEARSG